MIVSESPSKSDDQCGTFLSDSNPGRLLEKALLANGVSIFKDCWLTNSIICYPGKEGFDGKHVDYCHANLRKTIDELKPTVIIPLGYYATLGVLKGLWRKPFKTVSPWVGWNIPSQKLNTWICPTYHPSYVEKQKKKTDIQQLEMWFGRHIRAALSHKERPWDTVPDYAPMVEKITDPDKAARILRKFIKRGGVVAFDYEATTLKPDWPFSQIVSCSVCWEGKETIAYPWLGAAIEATYELLRSDLMKIGANIKFEQRWTMAEFGKGVKNWQWDAMNMAHLCDNRDDITSVKFQSFVRLGAETYDDHIHTLLRAKKGSKINQILKEIDLDQLLTYNGIDSIVEFEIAKLQMQELGYGCLIGR